MVLRVHSPLLIVGVASFVLAAVAGLGARLPGGNAAQEHLLDILKSLSSRLREAQEGVDGHGGAEDAEDEVNLPLDVDESGLEYVS